MVFCYFYSDHNYVSVSLPKEITDTTYSNAPREVEKITSPNDCLKCKKEIKGKCVTCQIRELKLALKEKDKQLKCVRYHNVKLEKIRSITKRKHQDRVKTYRKRINTWEKRYERILKYSMVKFSIIFYFRYDLSKTKIKYLLSFIRRLPQPLIIWRMRYWNLPQINLKKN